MEEIRCAAYLTDLIASQCQRAPRRDDRDVRVRKPILPGSKLQTRFASAELEYFIESVEPNVVVEQETRVVGEDFLNAAALKLNGLVGVIINPRLVDKERVMGDGRCEVLIERQRIVDRAGAELSMKAQCRADIGIHVQAKTITQPRVLNVLKRRVWSFGGAAQNRIVTKPEVTAEPNRAELEYLLFDFLNPGFERRRLIT